MRQSQTGFETKSLKQLQDNFKTALRLRSTRRPSQTLGTSNFFFETAKRFETDTLRCLNASLGSPRCSVLRSAAKCSHDQPVRLPSIQEVLPPNNVVSLTAQCSQTQAVSSARHIVSRQRAAPMRNAWATRGMASTTRGEAGRPGAKQCSEPKNVVSQMML